MIDTQSILDYRRVDPPRRFYVSDRSFNLWTGLTGLLSSRERKDHRNIQRMFARR